MWREIPDVFWDGLRSLLIGFLRDEPDTALGSSRARFAVASSIDANDATGGTLLDWIEPNRSETPFWMVKLPPGHFFIRLRSSPDDEIRITLTDSIEDDRGEWRALMVELHPCATFRIAASGGYSNPERFADSQIRLSGSALIWGVRQRCVTQNDGLGIVDLTIARSEKIFPVVNQRLVIEPLDLAVDLVPQSGLKVAVAIHEHAARESNSRRIALALSVTRVDAGLDDIRARSALVHVMTQRCMLSQWTDESREGNWTIIRSLNAIDVRRAIGDPHFLFDTVEEDDAVIVHNLGALLESTDSRPITGVVVSRDERRRGEQVDRWQITFCGATLGDIIGLVCNDAQVGDVLVRNHPSSPQTEAWMFRVDADKLTPVDIDGEDRAFVDDLLRRAADLEPCNKDQGSRYVLSEGLNRFIQSFDWPDSIRSFAEIAVEARRDLFWPFWVYAFAAPRSGASVVNYSRSYESFHEFRLDPALTRAIAQNANVLSGAPQRSDRQSDETAHLPRRYARYLGFPGLVAVELNINEQIEVWKTLNDTDLTDRLVSAKICLDGSSTDLATSRSCAAALGSEDLLNRVILSLEDRDRSSDAQALKDYLSARGEERWTPLSVAKLLGRHVEGTQALWRAMDDYSETAPSVVETKSEDKRDPAKLIADIDAVFLRAGALAFKPSVLASLKKRFERLKTSKQDRFILRDFEARVVAAMAAPAEMQRFDHLVSELEAWAGLPGFLARIAERLKLPQADSGKQKAVVAAYLNRVLREPALPRPTGVGDFERRRKAFAEMIAARGDFGKSLDISKDLQGFGDILFFHKSHTVIENILEWLKSDSEAASLLFQLRQSLSVWPRNCSRSWDMAAAARTTYAPELPEPSLDFSPERPVGRPGIGL